MNSKVNNDLKFDINDQQGFIFKKKQRVQEVFLFTNYEEGFLCLEDTKEGGYKAKDDGKKNSLFMRKTDKKNRHLNTSYTCNPFS